MDRFKALNGNDSESPIIVVTSEKIIEVIDFLPWVLMPFQWSIHYILQDLKQLYYGAMRAVRNGQHEMAFKIFHQILENDEIIQVFLFLHFFYFALMGHNHFLFG